MAAPLGEFRTISTTLTEPADRTTAGTIVESTSPLDFGTLNNTSGYVQSEPRAIWWRCTNLNGNSTISNMKFWLSANSDLTGTNEYYSDISDAWIQNKTVSQVAAGTPGTLPQSIPASNITKNGGGNITGITHADTSQYIYLAFSIGPDETIGQKGGTEGGFHLSLKFDYS